MTDKEKIIAEIERRLSVMPKSAWGTDELKRLLSFIDSMGEDRPEPISPADVGFEALGKVWDEKAKKESGELTHSVTKIGNQEESVSEDLIKAAELYADKKLEAVDPELSATNYQRHTKMRVRIFDGSDVEEAHLDGMKEMKQQMMKDAVDGEILDIFYPTGNSLELSAKIPEDRFEAGDKVKLIIIKVE